MTEASNTQSSVLPGDGVAGPLGTHYGICGQSAPQAHSKRAETYSMQDRSRDFLAGFTSPSGRPFRVLNCLRRRVKGTSDVAVTRHLETGRARFGHLQRCASGWTCPVCQSQISERRRREIETAMNVHHAAGGMALMVTFTHSHGRHDHLGTLVRLESLAMRKMTSWRGFKVLREEVGLVGTIRAREATFGESHGWHPHIHDLWLCSQRLTTQQLDDLRERLFQLWKKACLLVGLPLPSQERGLDVVESFSPAEYIAKFDRETKWGTGRELTKANSKRGGEDRYTPFDFLREVGSLSKGRRQALFLDFASAFFGISQVGWSQGLKTLMRIAELSDEQIVEGEGQMHELITTITPADWSRVLAARARSKVLDVAEAGGAVGVAALVATLPPVQGQASRTDAAKPAEGVQPEDHEAAPRDGGEPPCHELPTTSRQWLGLREPPLGGGGVVGG